MMNAREHGESMKRIREWYYNRVSALAARDYQAFGNPHRGKRGRIHKQYALGAETVDARDLYALTLAETWTDEQEQEIKTYKLRIELLAAAGAIS